MDINVNHIQKNAHENHTDLDAFFFKPTRLANIQSLAICSAGKDKRNVLVGSSHIVGGSAIEWAATCNKITIVFTACSRKLGSGNGWNICTSTHRKWHVLKVTHCSSAWKSKDTHLIRKCLNRLWYLCTLKYDAAVTKKKKKKGDATHGWTLKTLYFMKEYQSQKSTCGMIPFVWNIQNRHP